MLTTMEQAAEIDAAEVDQVVGDTEWDEFVRAHPQGHFLQGSAWAALKSDFGWAARRVTVQCDGKIVAGASLLRRRVAGLTIAYVPKGPVVDWDDPLVAHEVLARLEAVARAEGAAVLKVEPNLVDGFCARARLEGYGLRPSAHVIQPQSTVLLDITQPQDAVLAQMKSKWRYNIRLAERKGVTVRAGSADDLAAFGSMMRETGARDGFATHNAAYYSRAFELFRPNDAAFLFAEYEGQPLAAIVVALAGPTAVYLWGASNNLERNRMPNHALQWAGIRWAQERGATSYDFWGVPDELGLLALGRNNGRHAAAATTDLPLDLESLPEHGLWGVYRFKQGFGGEVVRWVGTWDRPVHPLRYRIYQAGIALSSPEHRADVVQKMRSTFSPSPSPPLWQEVTSAHRWRDVLATLPDPHVLQSWEWGAVKVQSGWQVRRRVLSSAKGEAQTAYQFMWRQPMPLLPLRFGYVPKGPLLDWADESLVERTLAAVEAEARAARCLFVKIDPDVDETSIEGHRLTWLLRQRGWRFSPEQVQFKNTATSDLRGGPEALLESMKSKWRYNVRLAERRGIQVRLGSADDLTAFYDLYRATSERDGFLIRPYDYYADVWHTYLAAQAEAENPAGGALLLAEHSDEDAPLAGIFLLRYGERAWYFYGASSERRRRDMPNYLLQWEAMRWAAQQGCTVYDWWGAPTLLDDPTDSMQGVWQFKQGFGAEFQAHIGAWDYPLITPLYRAYMEWRPMLLLWLRRVLR